MAQPRVPTSLPLANVNQSEEAQMATALQPQQPHYAGPPFGDAKVHDAMRLGVVTCQPETSLRDVTRIMVGYQIHSVVVGDLGTGQRPWGIVSDLDIATAAATDISNLTARDMASTDLVTVQANETLERAAELMAEHRAAHLLAVQPETGQPVGVISALGLAAVVAATR
jgi:CBS domain-containing protein